MEVIVNGRQVELGNSTPAITRKSIDINDPSARFIDFTNKFQLPDTLNNREIFESPAAIGSNNRSYDKLFDVEIRDVFQIFKGKGYLDQGTKDKFSLQVIDDSKILFKGIDVKLISILWDDCDTLLDQTSINALDSLDINNCWFWGKACYHERAFTQNTDQTTGDDRTMYSRPAFYVQGLLNRAIANVGYTLVSPLPDLAISSNHKQFFFTNYQKTFNATYNPAGTLAITGFDTYDFKHANISVTNTEVKNLLKANIRIRGNFTTTAPIYLFIHTIDQTSAKIIDNKFLLPTSGFADFMTSEIYDSPTGMTATFSLIGTGTVTFDDVLVYAVVNEKYEDLSTNPFLDMKIKAYDNLPDITYLDLFKLICVVSNKYPIVDNYNRTLSFGTLANLSKLDQVDWSDKFIQGSETISSQFGGLFKRNRLRYLNDITVNIDLGCFYFDTDNDNLKDDGDYIVVNFGASNDVSIGSNTVCQIPVYNDTSRVEDQEINIRLFAVVSDKLQFAPLTWWYLSENYYDEWFLSLYRIRAIEAEFNLNKLDVLSWRPKQLIYVDYFKTVFIVLEISNFIPGQRTRVKLLSYGR
jgi:hypothetical protein